jgi:type VI secretion system secreted protein Hcp
MITALKNSPVRYFAVLALIVAVASPVIGRAAQPHAVADFKMYLQVEGISGDVKAPGFENAIEVLAYSWGASSSGSFSGGGGGQVGKANFQDLSMTKYFDVSTPPLLLALAKGTHLAKATLTLVRRVNGADESFMVFAATEVLVSSLSTGASIGESPASLTETLTLNFATAKLTYKSLDGTVGEVVLDVTGAAN